MGYSTNLFRLNDNIEVNPLDGRKRTIKLKRTLITIKSGHEEKFSGESFTLRTAKKNYDFAMRRTYLEGDEAYEFVSLCECPFLHNGNISYKSVMRRGDIVDVGLYRFHFHENYCASQTRTKSMRGQDKLVRWPKDAFVSIEGETGTGKTTLAKRLHDQFCGEQLPFIGINLSAFNESLIESELFGHEKGSFTGAIREKRGAVELAREGTLFIDELDSLPKYLQVKLLTFLDNKKYRRVGGEIEKRAKCRVIFSSGRDLKKLVDEGLFRRDLFYRVTSGIHLKLLPLREDKKLIVEIIKDFERSQCVTLSEELKDYLLKYTWPGNYRELHGHLQRKLLLSQRSGYLELGKEEERLDLNEVLQVEKENVLSLAQVKENHCRRVYLRSRGSFELASRRLGISKSTLRRVLSA